MTETSDGSSGLLGYELQPCELQGAPLKRICRGGPAGCGSHPPHWEGRPLTTQTFAPPPKTRSAASGSPKMLASAAGLTLPFVKNAPPKTTSSAYAARPMYTLLRKPPLDVRPGSPVAPVASGGDGSARRPRVRPHADSLHPPPAPSPPPSRPSPGTR